MQPNHSAANGGTGAPNQQYYANQRHYPQYPLQNQPGSMPPPQVQNGPIAMTSPGYQNPGTAPPNYGHQAPYPPASQPQNQFAPSVPNRAPPPLAPAMQPTHTGSNMPSSMGQHHHDNMGHAANPQMARPIYGSGPGVTRPGVPPPGAPFPGPNEPAMPPQAPAASSRINPSMVPSPVVVNEADQSKFNEVAFVTSSLGQQLPPLPSTMTRYIDDGNCSSRFMRMTTYSLPCSEDQLHATRLPLAMIIQPFAERPQYEESIPLVDFGQEGPVRCSRCRAYMNPFMNFGKGGRVFVCNICFMQNDVRDSYFCSLDMMGRRSDIASRPELACGTIDVVAPLDYLTKKPSRATILFALDASKMAVQNGAFMAYVLSLKAFFTNPLLSQRYGRVGIITFDRNVQFYDLRSGLNEPQLVVMSDIMDPFVPLHDGLFFDPAADSSLALDLLERLPKLVQDTRSTDASIGSAVSAGFEAMKPTGGRLVIFAATSPTSGLGTVKARDEQTAINTANDKVQATLQPQGEYYRDVGKRCAKAGISVSVIATPVASVDLATLYDLCRLTSGLCLAYPRFSFEAHHKKLSEEVAKTLLRPAAYDCTTHIRCGSGLQTDLHFGQHVVTEAGDLRFACLDSQQSFATTFIYDARLAEGEKIGFQVAVLYTTFNGQARIRIHNMTLSASADLSNVFKHADLDALVNLTSKQISGQIQDQPLPFLNAQVSSRCAHVLAAYRKHCASTMSAGQLVLPDALKLLPLYMSCLLKQPPFQPSANVDYRIAFASELVSCAMETLPAILYPRLWALHNLSDQDPKRYYPACLRLTKEQLDPAGIYLIENGQRLMIWIGPQATPNILSDLFGASQVSAVNPNLSSLPELNNVLSTQVRTLLNKLHYQRSHYLALTVIRSGIDPSEHTDWLPMLIEDAQAGAPSYIDFLCRIHGQIQQELSTGPSLTERAAMLNFLH